MHQPSRVHPVALLLGFLVVFLGVVGLLFVFTQVLNHSRIQVVVTSHIPKTTITYVPSATFEKILASKASPNLRRVTVDIYSQAIDVTQFPFQMGTPDFLYQYDYSFQPDTLAVSFNFLNPRLDQHKVDLIIEKYLLGFALQQHQQHLGTVKAVDDNTVWQNSQKYLNQIFYDQSIGEYPIVKIQYE